MTIRNHSLFDLFLNFEAPMCRVVFPDGHDPRVIEAARRAERIGLIQPILLGPVDEISQISDAMGFGLEGIEVLDPETSELFDAFAQDFAETRDIPAHSARAMSSIPFYFAAMMLDQGMADAMVAGSTCSNQEMLMAIDLAIGTRADTRMPSSFSLLEIPGSASQKPRVLMLSDCLINPSPTACELAEIALNTAELAEAILGWDPCVAMLSHSTYPHPLEPHCQHVARALDEVRRRAPDLNVGGELQLDAALSSRAARCKLSPQKLMEDRVAGQANILVFPNLNASDIAIKVAQQLSSATVCGPVLHGFKFPIGLVSRAAQTRDILGTIALTAAYARAHLQLAPPMLHPMGFEFTLGGPDASPGVFA
ncbi:phosphotransacetylase [Bradymonas sediminis]|uniref:Uncharacterized protein n=1 Tax=Bradymonas sediminis TaxID=1548548 RepID=A0A2Z4FGS8_9DELT|nr:hypothetical protein DN745_02145 [Bradymonas sediminis]TDP77325.1 phosphotransacetylase [Bradymonas sediminis]